MTRILKFSALLFLFAIPVYAQSLAPQDFFNGRSDTPAPTKHPHRIAATCSESSSTILCTPSNFSSASVAFSNANMTNYAVTISSPSETINFSTGEPLCIDGTGTNQDNGGLDSVMESGSETQGADHLTSINTGTGQFTIAAFAANTVSSVSGFIRPCKASAQSGFVTPFGTGNQIADPLGNWFYVLAGGQYCTDQSQSCTSAYNTNLLAKYGTNCAAAKFLNIDLTQVMFFDAMGEDSSTQSVPNFGTCTTATRGQPLPAFQGSTTISLDVYEGSDTFGDAPAPVHALNLAVDRALSTGVAHYELDYFSPNAATHSANYLGGSGPGGASNGAWTNLENQYKAPSQFAFIGSDTDDMNAGDASYYWPTHPRSGQGMEPAYVAIISDPHIVYQNTGRYTGTDHKYPWVAVDDTNYSKKLSAVAPSGCYDTVASTTSFGGSLGPTFPKCSILDYIRNWFNGSLTSMNTAFGSSYTTFGSSETVVTGETPTTCTNSCVGNGSTTTFSITLNHTNATPGSVHVLLCYSGCSAAINAFGDCPFKFTATGGSSNCPTYAGETSSNGEIDNWRTWIASVYYPSESSVANSFCLVDSNNNIECETSGGKSGTSAPTWNLTVGGNTSDGTGGTIITWTNEGPAITQGSSTIITYSTSVITLTFASAPPSGEAITFNYTANGWSMGGTGLADEDGSSSVGGSTVVGTNPVALLTPPAWAASTSYPQWQVINDSASASAQVQVNPACTSASGATPAFSQTQGTVTNDNNCKWVSEGVQVVGSAAGANFAAANANATFGQIGEAWIEDYVGKYYDNFIPSLSNLFADQLIMFPDFLGEFSGPTWPQTLKVAQAEVPVGFFAQQSFDTNFDTLTFYRYQYIATYFTKPIIQETFYESTQSPSGGCDSPAVDFQCFTTQQSKGQEYYTYSNNSLHATTVNNNFNLAGHIWWSPTQDIQGKGYGLKSYADNLMNGVEDVAPLNVACSNGVGNLCGNEPNATVNANWASPYGYNALTCTNCVVAANKLWLQGAAPVTNGAATKSIMMARIIDPAWIAAETHYAQGEKR